MRILRIIPALLLATILTACGPRKAAPGEGVTLVLYHWMEKDRTLWEEQILKPFEQAHPGIRVVLQTSPYPLYVSKCLTSIASGTRLADVMYVEDWFGQELIQKRYAVNLMPYVRRDIPDSAVSTETFTEWRGVAQRPDELFGFPACLGLTVLFYNKDLFDRNGVPYPDTTWSYDDLIKAGKRLTIVRDGAVKQWGLCFDIAYTGMETVVHSFGGRVLTPNGRKATLTEPNTVRGLQCIQDIFLKHRIASTSTSYINPFEPFLSQRAAMVLVGSHGAINLESASMRWDITYPPKGPDGIRRSRRFTMAYMIPGNSPHPDEAWELIRWILTRSPASAVDRLYQGMMPTTRVLATSAGWLEAQPFYSRRLLVELEKGFSFPLFTPGWQEWRDNNLTPELVSMIRGDRSVEAAAASAEQRVNTVLDRAFAP